jgi:[acyl-carrier-protein] S-malonyltransferase
VLSGLAKRGPGGSAHAAATPEEVATVATELAGRSAAHARVEGETLFAPERLLVSTAAGVFSPSATLRDGAPIAIGDEVGRVGEHVVTSRFSGRLMGVLAWQGERVAPSQPLAWLRVG